MFPPPPLPPVAAYSISIGKVVDKDNNDISGAQITIKNLTKGTEYTETSTESDSNITLPVAKCGAWDDGDVFLVDVVYGATNNSKTVVISSTDYPGSRDLGTIRLNGFMDKLWGFMIDGRVSTDVIKATVLDTIVGTKKFEFMSAGISNFNAYEQFDDVQIAFDGVVIFRGRIERLLPDYDSSTLVLAGRDYLGELMEQNIIEAYTTRSRSYIVNDLLTKYGKSMTRNHIDSSPANTIITYTFKTSAWDALLKCTNEDGYQFWVDADKDFHYHLKSYRDSGMTMIVGEDPITEFEIEETAHDIINRVTVYGKTVGTTQVVVMVEDIDSQNTYGLIKEKRIIDSNIETDEDATNIANAYLSEHAWAIEMITIKAFGYAALNAGETIRVVNSKMNIDGNYLVINKSHEFPSQITTISVAKYAKHLESIIANMIEKLLQLEKIYIDDNAIIAKIHRIYENVKTHDRIIMDKKMTNDSFMIGIDGHCTIGTTTIGDRRGSRELIYDSGW